MHMEAPDSTPSPQAHYFMSSLSHSNIKGARLIAQWGGCLTCMYVSDLGSILRLGGEERHLGLIFCFFAHSWHQLAPL